MINLHIHIEITSCTLFKILNMYILIKMFEIDGQFLMMLAALLVREMTSLLSKLCKWFYYYYY